MMLLCRNGLITKVTPLTQIAVDDVPVLTADGSGRWCDT